MCPVSPGTHYIRVRLYHPGITPRRITRLSALGSTEVPINKQAVLIAFVVRY